MKELATVIEDYEYRNAVNVYVEFGGCPYVIIRMFKCGIKVMGVLACLEHDTFFKELDKKLNDMLKQLEEKINENQSEV